MSERDSGCIERHNNINERLNNVDNRLNNHGERIDRLEQKQSEFTVEIKNLCDNLKSLTATMKWFVGLLGGSFVGFFFYAVQQNIFK